MKNIQFLFRVIFLAGALFSAASWSYQKDEDGNPLKTETPAPGPASVTFGELLEKFSHANSGSSRLSLGNSKISLTGKACEILVIKGELTFIFYSNIQRETSEPGMYDLSVSVPEESQIFTHSSNSSRKAFKQIISTEIKCKNNQPMQEVTKVDLFGQEKQIQIYRYYSCGGSEEKLPSSVSLVCQY